VVHAEAAREELLDFCRAALLHISHDNAQPRVVRLGQPLGRGALLLRARARARARAGARVRVKVGVGVGVGVGVRVGVPSFLARSSSWRAVLTVSLRACTKTITFRVMGQE
jgi:hypothetical protein